MEQIISFNPDTVVAGQQFTLTVFHRVENSEEQPNDLGFTLYFDSEQLTFQDSNQIITPSQLLGPISDGDDDDNNPNTDQRIRFVLEPSSNFLPLEETELFTLNFDVADDHPLHRSLR